MGRRGKILVEYRMAVTLKDVAKRAGVSIPTVSLIINDHDLPFKESTRRAVLEAVEALNYRPDSMARRNANGSNRRDAVALLLRSESRTRVANSPAYEFICGVNDVLMEENQFLVMMKLHHLEQQDQSGAPPRVIAERFIDGLIVETGLPPQLEQAVDRYHIMTIWLNTNHHDPNDCIYPDEVHAGRIATEHLIQLGHQNILFLARLNASSSTLEEHFSAPHRQLGYEQTMTNRQLPTQVVFEKRKPDPQSINSGGGGTTATDLSDAVSAVMKSRSTASPITAVVTYEIGQAVRLRFDLQKAGLECPRDVSIIASEDLRYERRMWPEMAGVSCDRYQMGRQAAEMMLAKITMKGQPQPSRIFRGNLIVAATAAPPPNSASNKERAKPKARRRSP
jgi:LacI family transcriptional regulator